VDLDFESLARVGQECGGVRVRGHRVITSAWWCLGISTMHAIVSIAKITTRLKGSLGGETNINPWKNNFLLISSTPPSLIYMSAGSRSSGRYGPSI